jgi:hypothetical protein
MSAARAMILLVAMQKSMHSMGFERHPHAVSEATKGCALEAR